MDIYQSMGFVDHFTPLPDIEALAVAIGGDHVAPVIEPTLSTGVTALVTAAQTWLAR